MNASYWVFGMAIAAGLSAQAEDCTVIIQVNSGPDRELILRRAETITSAMFREIGIEVSWRRGTVQETADHACGAPIVLRVEASGARPSAPEGPLAYATPFAESDACIHIFMDRVLRGRNVEFSTVVLAHVMTHEITHMLQQINRHSPDGIMKARWDAQDYWRMSSHPLTFAPIDVELIHLGIAKRTQRTTTELAATLSSR